VKAASLYRDDEVFVRKVWLAGTPSERMKGLLGRRGLSGNEGMLIDRCGSIHTFFMAFTIDVVFLDAELHVLRAVAGVTPFRLVFGGSASGMALETQSGWLPLDRLKRGDQLQLVQNCEPDPRPY
jgi:uncharacterized membrane protein (UPF0127 family)